MTKHHKSDAQKTPSKYATFYLVMLILTTISVGFGLLSLGSISTTIKYFDTAPLFAGLTLVQYAVTLLMVVALVYLYKKKELGLHFLISSYGLTTICMIIFPIAAQPLVRESAAQVVADSKGEITIDFATNILQIMFMSIAVASAFMSILFAVLWYFAWKKQVKRDTGTI